MHRPLLLALLLLAGCSTFRHGARKGELVLTKGKSTSYFTVPPDWVAGISIGAINAFKGPVMKAGKGKANPKLVDETLRRLLAAS